MKTETEQKQTKGAFACSAWFCVLWSGAEVGLVWWAVTTGATGPGNIVKLWGGYCALISPLMLLVACVEKKADTRPVWLRSLMNLSDCSLVVILAWWGWWWCAVAYLMGAVSSAAFRARGGKSQNKHSGKPPTF
jgi:hypothetical protein